MDWVLWLGLAVLAAGALALFLGLRRRAPASGTIASAVQSLAQSQAALGARLEQLTGQLSQISHDQLARHANLSAEINKRLDAVSDRVGQTLTDQGTKTVESLGQLQLRLSAIDAAQKNIVELSGQVVSLQDILANKQARGAFGQAQMEHIVRDTLPAGTYRFNAPLSNATRPDCTIHLPQQAASIVIDAKFPRESFEALSGADSAEGKRAAEARVRAEVKKHIDDIAGKYLVPGETQDPAIMFVPAESIYATVFSDFYDIIQHAQRKRVVIVSPNMLMLAVNTMRALMRDHKMREQAHQIQKEVRQLMEDVRRLGDRTHSLKRHFAQAEDDIRQIETSTEKIAKRGEKIESVEIEAPAEGKVLEGASAPRLEAPEAQHAPRVAPAA